MCIMDSYIPQIQSEIDLNHTDDTETAYDKTTWIGSIKDRVYRTAQDWLWVWLFADHRKTPWFMRGKDRIAQKLNNSSQLTSHPYMSPMYYEHLDEISRETKLTLIALDMDPTLDQSIAMARRWKGEVDFDVVRDLPHAYLNFVSFAFKYWGGYYYSIDKMRSVMGYEKKFENCYKY